MEGRYYYTALSKYRAKNYRKTIANIMNYLEDPKAGIDEKGLFILAKSYQALRMLNESERTYKIIMMLNPNNIYARTELAKLYAKQRKEKEAEILLKEVIQLSFENVYARLELGKLYVKQGRETEAERLFLEVIKLNFQDRFARLELGKLYVFMLN